MEKDEIKTIRLTIKTQIAELENKLNEDSKRFYGMFAKVIRSNSIGTLVHEWIGELNEYTEDAYISLQDNWSILTDLQRLHQQLLELEVLEQAV